MIFDVFCQTFVGEFHQEIENAQVISEATNKYIASPTKTKPFFYRLIFWVISEPVPKMVMVDSSKTMKENFDKSSAKFSHKPTLIRQKFHETLVPSFFDYMVLAILQFEIYAFERLFFISILLQKETE